MTPLGRALSFYCRYGEQMNYLYDTETPDVSSLDDGEKVLEMARALGNQASTEAATLVQECGRRIREYFESMGFRIAREPRGARVLREWRWFGYLRSDADPDLDLECGVQISASARAVFTWFWRRKAKGWQTEVFARLGKKAHPESSDPSEVGGHTIFLPPVPIPIHDAVIDRDVLIQEAVSRFQAITADEIRSIGGDGDG